MTNTDTGTVEGSTFGINAAATADVTNLGTITGGVFGINANSAANVINFGTISAAIGISASASNVTNNMGTISGTIFGVSADVAAISNSGSINGGTFGILATTAAVTNQGTIRVGAGGTGINATSIADVANSGTISGGAFGISANGVAEVSNSGTISGSTAGVSAGSANLTNTGLIAGATGIRLAQNSTILNEGAIVGNGGIAINFAAGTNTLTVAPGFTIVGRVIGSGADTFQLGGAGSGTLDLGLIGPGQQYEGFSNFNKVGASTWTVTGSSSQSGSWAVQGGTLLLNGDLSAASGIRIDSGAALSGAGTAPTLTVSDGASLMPGLPGEIGTLHVAGNLMLAGAAGYLAQVSPTTASLVSINGTAAIGGTLMVTGTGGAYSVGQTYPILFASGGATGVFSKIEIAGSFGSTQPTISYDFNGAFIVLTPAMLGSHLPSGSSTNASNVARAIDSANVGTPPLAFQDLFSLPPPQLQSVLAQASGESATGSQQATFEAMNLFVGLLTDPFMGRGGGFDGVMQPAGYADESTRAYAASRRNDVFAIFAEAPVPFVQRWNVWAAGYGGAQSTGGNTFVGSNNAISRIAGTAVGADYLFSPNTLAGFAIAGGGTGFDVNNLGSGRSDLFQAGAYIRHTDGPAYITSALAYGWQDITIDRSVSIAGLDRLRAEFKANAYSGRVEGGYRVFEPWFGGIGITPYAAGQFTTFDLPAFAESVVSGTPNFALNYAAESVNDSRSELGIRSDRSLGMSNGILTLRGRFAWAHDFDPDRAIAATFQGLPGASFVVNGAAQARDSALITASAEQKWTSGWSMAATFEEQLSDVSRTYAGKAIVHYRW
jgi:uncharacterized protein with beta-barrel porin domain